MMGDGKYFQTSDNKINNIYYLKKKKKMSNFVKLPGG